MVCFLVSVWPDLLVVVSSGRLRIAVAVAGFSVALSRGWISSSPWFFSSFLSAVQARLYPTDSGLSCGC